MLVFSQPVEKGAGALHFEQFLESRPQFVVRRFAVGSEAAVMERSERVEMVFPAEKLPLEPNSFYRLRVDENIVKNEVWSKVKKTATLEMVIRTADDHCKYVKVASSVGKKVEVLCQYVETRCFCQQIFIWSVCSKISCRMEKKAKKDKDKKVLKKPAKAKVIEGEKKPAKKNSDSKTGKCRGVL